MKIRLFGGILAIGILAGLVNVRTLYAAKQLANTAWITNPMNAVKNGILVDPGYQSVCFDSSRPGLEKGTAFDPLPPGASVKVTITGDCPFDSGCDVYRITEGNVFTTVNGSNKPNDPKPSLDPAKPYVFQNKEEPVLIKHVPKGPVQEAVREQGLENHRMYFYIGRGKNNEPTETVQISEGPTINPGDANSLNQSQLNFNSESVTGTPTGGQSRVCKFIVWDPFGRVFDAQSLEPIPNTRVTLIDAQTDKPAIQFDANYAVTLVDGLFNILVGQPGMYKIRVKPPETHRNASKPTLAPGFEKMYFDLYEPETEYEEKYNVPTHHDIAVVPVGAPYIAPFVETMKINNGIHMGTSLLFDGRVSHPLAHVCLFGEKTKLRYACDEDDADAFGVYLISVPADKAPLFERLIPVATKYNEPAPTGGRVVDYAISIGKGYEPIFGFVDGYAKDEMGNVLPYAKVQVIESGREMLISEVSADEKGYFKLTSEKLPISGYHLLITSKDGGSPIQKMNSVFAEQNRAYLTSQKLDLILPRSNMRSGITSPQKFVNRAPTGYAVPQPNQAVQKPAIAVIVAIILLTASVGVIGFVILTKNNHESTSTRP